MRRFTSQWLVAMMALALPLAFHAQEPAPPKQSFIVGYFPLGPDALAETPPTRNFVERLGARPGFATESAERLRPTAWKLLPKATPPEEWLSLCVSIFGKRQNWVALQFAGPEGSVSLAAWRPGLAAANTQKYSYMNTIPPGPDQIAGLALIELAAAVGQQREQPSTVARERVAVIIEPWRDAAEQAAGALLDIDGDGAGSTAQPASGEALEAIAPLVLAAAWDAGLQPKLGGQAPATLRLQVSRVIEGYGLKVTWKHGDTTRTIVKERLPETMLYPGMVAVIAWATRYGDGIHDIVQVEPWPIWPLSCSEERFVYRRHEHTDHSSLAAVAVASLLPQWQIPQPDRLPPDYTTRLEADGSRTVYSYSPWIGRVDVERGVVGHVKLGRETSRPGAFVPLGEDGCLYLDGRAVVRTQAAKAVWQQTVAMSFSAGPAIAGETAVAASLDGTVHAFALADGQPRWQRLLPGRPYGDIVLADELALVATEEGLLAALRVADGSIVWQGELGDALAAAPWPVGDQVVVAWGSGQLSVLSLADGTETARASRPAAWHAVVPIPLADKPLVAGIEIDGTVSFYAVPTLAERGRVALDRRLITPPLFVPKAPARWGTRDELVDLLPLLLVPDAEGLTFIVRIPE